MYTKNAIAETVLAVVILFLVVTFCFAIPTNATEMKAPDSILYTYGKTKVLLKIQATDKISGCILRVETREFDPYQVDLDYGKYDWEPKTARIPGAKVECKKVNDKVILDFNKD